MATTFQLTDLIVAGTAFTYAAPGDGYWIGEGVTVGSGSGAAINGSHSNLRLDIFGHVHGGGSGNTIVLNGGGAKVHVGDSGSITSNAASGSSALLLSGGGSSLVNDGSINAMGAIGVLFSGGGNHVVNNGAIHGGSNGVFMGLFGGQRDVLINFGQISAGNTVFDQSGRFNHGVHTEGNGAVIVNHGSIAASHAIGAGVNIGATSLGGAGGSVENHGSITSAQFWGVDMFFLPSGSASVVNYGLISGGTGGIRGGNFGGEVVNRGTIVGDIAFTGGTVTYDGDGGFVDGWVRGGTGNATLTGGDRSDRLHAGSGGVNVLEGGAGGDTLLGGSGVDTASYAGSNAAVVVNLLTGAASGGHAAGDTLVGIEHLTESTFADALTGDHGANVILGGRGDDRLDGGSGNDALDGGEGSDTALLAGLNGAGGDILNFGGAIYSIDRSDGSFDAFVNIESYTDGFQTISTGQMDLFDGLDYAASYDDLALAFPHRRHRSDLALSHQRLQRGT